MNETRKRWTLAHELAHIFLGHFSFKELAYNNLKSLTLSQFNILERESNQFTAQILAPMPVLKALHVYDAESISDLCNISMHSSQNREKELNWFKNCSSYKKYDNEILNHFKDFILSKNPNINKSIFIDDIAYDCMENCFFSKTHLCESCIDEEYDIVKSFEIS